MNEQDAQIIEKDREDDFKNMPAGSSSLRIRSCQRRRTILD